MTILELHYSLELEIDKLSNGNNPGTTDREKDKLFKEAIDDYIDLFWYGVNNKGLIIKGFEADTRKTSMFDGLIFRYPVEPAIKSPKNLGDNYYSFDLTKTSKTYQEHISSKIKTDCGDFDVVIPQSNDNVEDNYHKKTSKTWKRVNAYIDSKTLIFRAVDFTPISLKLTYLKKPNEVCIGTYPDLDKLENETNPTNKVRVECDLPARYHNLLVDIAAQNFMEKYQDQIGYSIKENRINKLN